MVYHRARVGAYVTSSGACPPLEGTYTEVYPEIGWDAAGLRRLFRLFSFPAGLPSHLFSFPAGIPSHVAPETPGSIHPAIPLSIAGSARSAAHARSSGTACPAAVRVATAATRGFGSEHVSAVVTAARTLSQRLGWPHPEAG